MTFISFEFYVFLIAVLPLYYIFPLRQRWIILLMSSMTFYYLADRQALRILITTVLVSYVLGLWIHYSKKGDITKRKLRLIISLCLVATPFAIVKWGNFVLSSWLHRDKINFIVPLGMAFYTMQIVAYLVDVYKDKIPPEKSLFKYMLFITYFPQIIQGPIPRYDNLRKSLFRDNSFDADRVTKGLQLIIWCCGQAFL